MSVGVSSVSVFIKISPFTSTKGMSSVSIFINTFPSTSTKGVLSVSVFIKTFPSTSTKDVKSGSVFGSTLKGQVLFVARCLNTHYSFFRPFPCCQLEQVE